MTFDTFMGGALKPVAIFFRDVRSSLFPHGDAELRLVDEQLTLARNATWPNVFVLPLAAIFVALANSAWVPLPRLIIWPLVMSNARIRTQNAMQSPASIQSLADLSIRGMAASVTR